MTTTAIRTTTTFVALAVLAAGACANSSTGSAAMADQIREENKRSVQTLFDNCFNQGDLTLLDRLVAADYVGPQGGKGPAGFRGVVVLLRTGFPDIHYTVEDLVAEGDRVAVRWRWTGTHKGPYRAFQPTGRTFSNPGVGIFQFKDGKIVAATLETDRLGFLQQMGAVPENIGAGPPPPAAAAR